MNKDYLVIGGHGFIGSTFCKSLPEETFDIYDINKPTGEPRYDIVQSRKKGLPESIKFSDIRHRKYKYLVHFGAYAGVRDLRDPKEFFDNNVNSLLNVIREVVADKVIYISSSSVLGDVESPYSLSKKVAENIISFIPASTIIRPFTVYGKNGRPDMLITRCLSGQKINVNGDPESILRRYTYVGDVVKAILGLKDSPGVYNLIGENEYSIKQVLDISGNEFEVIRPNDKDFKVLALDKAQQWPCKTKLEDYFEGVKNAL